MERAEFFVQQIETPIGPFEALWNARGLWAFQFANVERLNATVEQADRLRLSQPPKHVVDDVILLPRAVDEYFQMGDFQWDIDSLDWQGIGRFSQRVLRTCYSIPAGCVMTYGELAAQVGSPRAARAVGGAMAANRWPLLIPCHRVVGSGGRLTGYSGRGGLQTKKQLIEMESEIKLLPRLVGNF